MLNFLNFDLEGSEPTCSFDYVTVHDGESIDAPMIGGRMCGVKVGPKMGFSRGKGLLKNYKLMIVSF